MFGNIPQDKKKKIAIGTAGIIIAVLGYALYTKDSASVPSGKIEVTDTTVRVQAPETFLGTEAGTLADIKVGSYAMVMGEKKDDGIAVARTVVVGKTLEKVRAISFSGRNKDATSTEDVSDKNVAPIPGDAPSGIPIQRPGLASSTSAIVMERLIGKVTAGDIGTVTLLQEDGNSVLVIVPESVKVMVVK